MNSLEMNVKSLNIDKSNWELTRLSDLAKEISKRVDNPGESEYDRFVGLGNFVSGDIKIKTWETTQNLASSAKAFEAGDILFARRNAYLRRASLVDFDGCCSGDAFVLRENHEKVVPGFLAFLMNSNSLWDFANSNAAGTMSKRVKWRDLAEYEFLLPPKDQQAQLAELLWAMDEVIERENVILEILDKLLFVFRERKLSSKNFKKEPLGYGLKDIVAGKSLRGHNIPATGNDKAVIKVSAVGQNGFVPEENKTLDDQSSFIEKYQVKKGDVLITRANTTELVGRTCYIDCDYANLMLSDKTLKLLPNDKLNPHYSSEILRTYDARRQIESFATGTGGAMKNITQPEIRSVRIPLPERKKQDEMIKSIELIKNNRSASEEKISSSQTLQKSLINQVF